MLRNNQKIAMALIAGAVVLASASASFAQATAEPAVLSGTAEPESAADLGTGSKRTRAAPKGDAITVTEQPETSTQEKKRKYEKPELPEGMTLDDVLDRAAKPPPEAFPDAVPDDALHIFLLGDRLEYRFDPGAGPDQVGLEMQGWFGGDYHRLWMKFEGEIVWQGVDDLEGGTETDLLYSLLFSPFWNVQIGAQYANEWKSDDYEDRWSGVLALQGLAPLMFEVDLSTYLSEDVDLTFVLEAEYDIRITQRLVLQPRTELGFAAQDIPERNIGAGMTDAIVDLRLRYEIKREFALFIGGRFHALVGETADLAEEAGQDPIRLLLIAGVRFAVY